MSKVVIIGSGLGGLSCGVILAKNGYDVTILEQQRQPGGCLQCFTRRGVKFETGMHFIGSAGEGQTLHKLLHYLGADVPLSPLDADSYEVISLNGHHYQFASGRENFINKLVEQFPSEREELNKLCDLIEHVSNASSLHSLKHTENDQAVDARYQLISINQVIEEYISDPTLRNVLVGNLPLYAAEKDKTPFSTYAFVMDFYNQSSWRIIRGSEQIANSLIATLNKYRGEVICGKKVVHVECNETHATGVRCEDGSIYPADIVIADIHPARLLELVDSPLLRPAYRKRIHILPNTIGSFSVYLDFKDREVPYMNHNFYGYRQDTPWGCENYNDEDWPRGYLYMHFCCEANQKYAKSGVILSYMHMADVEKWADTYIGHRGSDYELFKKEHAERLLDVVEKDFPDIRRHLAHYYTSTPLTYRDYTGTEGGSMYGIAKDINLGPAGRVHHRTKIPNLFLTGQNINSHGILGVLVGTMVTCGELLTSERIFNQIANE